MTAIAATALEACANCPGLCRTCPVDDGEWPPRDQTAIADAEADGLAYAGANAAPPTETLERTWAHHRQWRQASHNRARFGDGGLFDELEP